jgi:hypothetical protein
VTRPSVSVGLAWVLASVGVVGSVRAWLTMWPSAPPETRPFAKAPAMPATFDTAATYSAATVLQSHDPFRFQHRPSQNRLDPWKQDQQAATGGPSPPARPVLAMTGLVGGPPWTVLIEGIPGYESGLLMALGQKTGGIALRALRGDTAILSGLDTTWVLTPRRVLP